MKLRAYAKINLGLDVLRRRADGYHEVKMIMQMVDLYDELEMEKEQKPGIYLSTNKGELPVDENNLIYKAAKLLMNHFQVQEGVRIHLEKAIPVAAGMAGGSSDAAATLVGINALFNLGLTKEELMKFGVKIGADVPYCVMRNTALAEGIGEKLTPLQDMPACYLLIGKPDISVSTKFVYTNLKLDETTVHPDIDGMRQALEQQDLNGICVRLSNVLESVTIPAYPVIDEIKSFMKNEGAVNALMSGSGPTVFGIFDEKEKAKHAYEQLKMSGLCKDVILTKPFHEGGALNDK